jgi:hypothetical protein
LEFGGPAISEEFVVGPPEFYVHRPGFWFGAAGVAACWYGGAVGLVDDLLEWIGAEPSEFALMDLGFASGSLESMRLVLESAASEIDADPTDELHRAQFRALVTRQIVHDAAVAILNRVSSAGGARPLCHDEGQSRRVADLYIYLSQHHGNVDAAELGRMYARVRSWN